MSTPSDVAAPAGPTPFEQVRSEAHTWIVREAYNGRKIDDGWFEDHESYVWAPKREHVEDFVPLPLSSVLDRGLGVSPIVEQTGPIRRGFVWPLCGFIATVVGVTVFEPALLDMLALTPVALGILSVARTAGRTQPAVATKAEPGGRSSKWDIGLLPGHNVNVTSFEVVPEVAYVYRFLKEAPTRLVGLNADTEAIAAAERAWETVLREISRLPEEAFVYRGKSKRLSNGQKGSVAHTRIMDAGAEILLMVRAAEETEYALAPQSPTPMGPWSQLSSEPVVVDMLNRAQSAQDLSPRLT